MSDRTLLKKTSSKSWKGRLQKDGWKWPFSVFLLPSTLLMENDMYLLRGNIRRKNCNMVSWSMSFANYPVGHWARHQKLQMWTLSIPVQYISLHLPLTHISNSIGNRKETSEWGIKSLHCKVQLLMLLFIPMKLSVMLIMPHLVLSWVAEWLRVNYCT